MCTAPARGAQPVHCRQNADPRSCDARCAADGVAACERDLGPTILKNWLVFVPATFINLGFVPLELRVLFINVVFFFWVIFLSLLINDDEASKQV